jgi:ketosteroid isomerase-like protein
MAERSPEIEQVLRDTMDAMQRSDIAAIERRTSRDDGVVTIGSDPNEWGQGYDEIMRLWRESMPDGAMEVRSGVDDVAAYREQSVGWAAARAWFEVEGRRVPVRLTAVFHQEDGEWKAVQTHASIGVPNDRMLDPMFQGGAT